MFKYMYRGVCVVHVVYYLMQIYLSIILLLLCKKFIHDLFKDMKTEIVLYLLLSKNLGFLVDKIEDMTKSVH